MRLQEDLFLQNGELFALEINRKPTAFVCNEQLQGLCNKRPIPSFYNGHSRIEFRIRKLISSKGENFSKNMQ